MEITTSAAMASQHTPCTKKRGSTSGTAGMVDASPTSADKPSKRRCSISSQPDDSSTDNRSMSPADVFLRAATVMAQASARAVASVTTAESDHEDGNVAGAAGAAIPVGSTSLNARRRVDDLNDRIYEAMSDTGSLTSQQLFDLAKPYYDLNPSKSELSQWARARIANLRRKRKVWPTAHMVYGTIKPEGYSRDASNDRNGMWEFRGLRHSIDASNFLEAPRTVYWSWEHGLKKHNLTVDVAGGGSLAGSAAEASTPSAGTSDNGAGGMRNFEQKILFKFEAGTAGFTETMQTTTARDTEPFESLAGISSSEVLSPTADIRDAMLLTRISSPVNQQSENTTTESQSGQATYSRPSSNGGGWASGDGSSPLPLSPDAQSNPDSSNRLLMLAMIAKEYHDTSETKKTRPAQTRNGSIGAANILSGNGRRGPKGPHRGAKYRCGKCGFYPKSFPHDCTTGLPRSGAEKVAKPAAVPVRSTDTPRYQARPKQYACGKCGFFPKSILHDCATGERTNTAVKPGKVQNEQKRRPPRRETQSVSPGRPRQYRCGKCGFFPKSTKHDCATGRALTPNDGASKVAGKGAESAKKDVNAAGNRRRQYKCGRCNFFPKTQPHDCIGDKIGLAIAKNGSATVSPVHRSKGRLGKSDDASPDIGKQPRTTFKTPDSAQKIAALTAASFKTPETAGPPIGPPPLLQVVQQK